MQIFIPVEIKKKKRHFLTDCLVFTVENLTTANMLEAISFRLPTSPCVFDILKMFVSRGSSDKRCLSLTNKN